MTQTHEDPKPDLSRPPAPPARHEPAKPKTKPEDAGQEVGEDGDRGGVKDGQDGDRGGEEVGEDGDRGGKGHETSKD